jgi:hypothetical protein
MISARSRCESHESVDLAWLSTGGTYDTATARVWTYAGGLQISAYPEPWAVVLQVDGNSHRIPLTYTETRFGGRRPWFACPHCQTARRVLYMGQRGFACRMCLDLRYSSQVEDPISKATRQRRRVLAKVGGELSGPFPVKPKRMHWRTYRALEARSLECMESLTAAVRRALG